MMDPKYYENVLKKFDNTPVNVCKGCVMYAVHGKKCWYYHANKRECSAKEEMADETE